MTTKPPPVPPESVSDKGPGGSDEGPSSTAHGRRPVPKNLKEQGRQGNINQNTHHQGYQQDR